MNKNFLYSIGQQVMIPKSYFPQGHKPTKGDIYTISGRRVEDSDPGDPFNDPGNHYYFKELPNMSIRESDISGAVETSDLFTAPKGDARLTFTVTLTFNSPVSEADIQEVADNVAEAIVHESDNIGIAPEEADTFATHVQVAHSGIILNETDI